MDALERLKLRTGEPDEAVLLDCLESAKAAILSRRFPFGNWPVRKVETEIPPVMGEDPETGDEVIVTPGRTETTEETYVEPKYLDLQYRIAMDLYNKAGAEGELSHSENGVRRSYESSWISEQLLKEIIPFCGVFG